MKLSTLLVALVVALALCVCLVQAASDDSMDDSTGSNVGSGGLSDDNKDLNATETDEDLCSRVPILIFIWPDGEEEPVFGEPLEPMEGEDDETDMEENTYSSYYRRPYVSPYYRRPYVSPYYRRPYVSPYYRR
jgi:hypothetical protein